MANGQTAVWFGDDFETVGVDVAVPDNAVATAEPALLTVPTMSDEDLEYLLMHNENSVAFDARRTTLEIWAEELGESAEEEGDAGEEEPDDAGPVTSQP